MCIFVALSQRDWYILGSNRDDQADRKTDTTVTYDSTRHCQYVKDLQSWWTRLAVYDSWLYAVLLNHSPSVKKQVFPSRGELPLSVIDLLLLNLSDWNIDKILEHIDIKNYDSCVLAVWNISKGVFTHHILTWDAVNKSLDKKIATWNLFLAASTLYPESTHTLWAEDLEKITDKKWLRWFMETHRYNFDSSCCIPKIGTVTKSMSIIVYNLHNKDMMYDYYPNYVMGEYVYSNKINLIKE